MLTPVEMQGRELKQGRGYQKKDADEFLSEIHRDYETLYRENMELKDKVSTLSDGLKYYKDLEKTLQKTLVVAEKTAEETTKISQKKASIIISDAQMKASQIVQEANSYFEKAQSNIKALIQQYESYRIQCKKLADANLDLLNSDAFKVDFEMVGLNMPHFVMPSAEVLELEENVEEKVENNIDEKKQENDSTMKTAEKVSAPVKNNKANEAKELDAELFEFFNISDDE